MPGRILKGGCFCGETAYTINVPETLPLVEGTTHLSPTCVIDHCNTCRRTSGSIFRAWITVPEPWITIISHPKEGENSKLVHFESSPQVHRSFCGICGTHLFYKKEDSWHKVSAIEEKVHLVDITIGSLDEESLAQVDLVKPSMHLWWKDGIGWVKDMFDSESGKGTFGGLRRYITGDIGINAEEV
ncbi:hypothetical protein M422DRAFT_169644 [Sphaerobolus stellatus SS14]|uniref:CENP-V/GFA domain-containing protein n=1 Tax=Sphaerobolus stellatus (strain SS14) TaxID=990650 RepID=A0A0C9VXB6_SPHS4|nr:hypothetical protein M422DRAFT_169644 [Sphaerobolus stellatus SS14]